MDRGEVMTELTLQLAGRLERVTVHTAIVAGWTGRDQTAVEEHIAELEALGVPRPSQTPVFYRVSAARVTTAREIESTPASSGEAEAVLLRHEGRTYVGIGSDHTDREVEAYGVAVAKQLCDKPIGSDFWRYEDVLPHWDRLGIRSWIDGKTLYQDGTFDGLLHPDELMARSDPAFVDGTLMFCGTFAAIGGVRPASSFHYELADPVLGRRLMARYEMRTLPLVT
jgi:hypothetical protein